MLKHYHKNGERLVGVICLLIVLSPAEACLTVPVAESMSQSDSGKAVCCSRKLFLNLLGQQTHSGL